VYIMIKAERLELIRSHINADKKVLLSELSTLLNVSEDTVRRDIKELSDQGLLKAVRGGAIAHSPIPRHFRDRQHYDIAHKEIIARKALQFVTDNQVVVFDGGTSVLAVAAAIPPEICFTAITHSFPVATVLEDHPNAKVIFAGGILNKKAFVTMGYETIQTFKNVRADICFLGICSIDINLGITGADYEDCQIKKTLIENSSKIIALTTREKIGTAEPFYISAANTIDTIITDIDPDSREMEIYRSAGIAIL
jgi:DeoR/GlpR family transcriptional regulator of sugar metabolism